MRNHLLEDISHLIKSQHLEEITPSINQQHPDLTVSILHKQQIQRIKNRLKNVHPADITYLLEALPQQQRLYVWVNIEADKTGDILLELSDAIRASLLSNMAPHEMVSATEKLDNDEIADLAPNLSPK